MTLLKRLEIAHARPGLLAPEALELTVGEGADEIEICEHTSQLVDGKRTQLLILISTCRRRRCSG